MELRVMSAFGLELSRNPLMSRHSVRGLASLNDLNRELGSRCETVVGRSGSLGARVGWYALDCSVSIWMLKSRSVDLAISSASRIARVCPFRIWCVA